MSRRVLVTGAEGFVGTHLTARLGPAAIPADADVTEIEEVVAAIRASRPDAVVHLAARASVGQSWEARHEVWRVNVLGTVNVLDAVREEAGDARVVVVSSGDVYGNAERIPTPEDDPVAPLSPYAASKAAAEIAALRAARADGLDVVVARAFQQVGPGQDERFAIGSWTSQIARLEATGGGTLRVGDLTVKRDLLDVRDVCRAYEVLLDRAVPGGVYNVATGDPVPFAQAVEILVRLATVPISTKIEPERLRRVDIRVQAGDSSRLREATGWRPEIPLERTLADSLAEARRRAARGEAVPA